LGVLHYITLQGQAFRVDTQRDMQTQRHVDGKTSTYKPRDRDRHTDRDRQTETDRQRQTETDRQKRRDRHTSVIRMLDNKGGSRKYRQRHPDSHTGIVRNT